MNQDFVEGSTNEYHAKTTHRLEERKELLDIMVHGVTGTNHHHDLYRQIGGIRGKHRGCGRSFHKSLAIVRKNIYTSDRPRHA
jgi:hypothetical protein